MDWADQVEQQAGQGKIEEAATVAIVATKSKYTWAGCIANLG